MQTTDSSSSDPTQRDLYLVTAQADFVEVFTRDMKGLHRLALLLTGDPARAIGCMAAAMAECVEGPAVKVQYGELWARRAVAKNAIADALGPGPWLADRWWDIAELEADHDGCGDKGTDLDVDSLNAMDSLERIVNVLCRIEGYSVHQCASLIGIAAKDLGEVQPSTPAEPDRVTIAIAA